MRVAIVHDWFVTYAGSERVVEQLLALFPQADLFSLVDFLPPSDRRMLRGKPVRTSFLQRMPFARGAYAAYLPLMPLAIEQLDLSRYDLVISSSHCVAKGVLTGPEQLHISYVHTPMRYAWEGQHEYLRSSGLERGLPSWLARWMLHRLRLWDVRSAAGVDSLVANSRFVAARIRKSYGRAARVIYPPVDTAGFPLGEKRDDYYLTASRLVPYKRVDVLVEAFARMPTRRLVVIGDGAELKRLRRAAGRNVQFLGQQDHGVVRDYLARAGAFVFAAREDFGIVLAEAQAAGTPVIAFGRGGAAEIVRGLDADRPTGVLFEQQSAAAVIDAISEFERQASRIKSTDCRDNAARFSTERFHHEFYEHVMDLWSGFQTGTFLSDQPRDSAGFPAGPTNDEILTIRSRRAA